MTKIVRALREMVMTGLIVHELIGVPLQQANIQNLSSNTAFSIKTVDHQSQCQQIYSFTIKAAPECLTPGGGGVGSPEWVGNSQI